jgi:hypothetical protein
MQAFTNGGDQCVDHLDFRLGEFVAVEGPDMPKGFVEGTPAIREGRRKGIACQNMPERPQAPPVAPCLDEALNCLE